MPKVFKLDPDITLSHSRIEKVMGCPFRYYSLERYKRMGIDLPTSPIAEEGRLAHKISEEYSKHCVADKVETDFEFLENLLSRYSHSNGFENVEFKVGRSCREITHRPGMMVETKIAIDKDFRVVDWDSEQAVFRGIIDLGEQLPGTSMFVLTDHKTGFVKEIKSDDQMRRYATLVFAKFPEIEEVKTQFFHFMWGKVQAGPTYYRESDYDYMKSVMNIEIMEVREIIKNKKYRAKISPDCGFCELGPSGLCGPLNKILQINPDYIITKDNFGDSVNKLLAYKECYSAIWSKAQKFMKSSPIPRKVKDTFVFLDNKKEYPQKTAAEALVQAITFARNFEENNPTADNKPPTKASEILNGIKLSGAQVEKINKNLGHQLFDPEEKLIVKANKTGPENGWSESYIEYCTDDDGDAYQRRKCLKTGREIEEED